MADSLPEKEVHFEDVLDLAGGTGRWQLLLLSWMSVMFLTVPFFCMSMMFMGATPEFRCADGLPANATWTRAAGGGARCAGPAGAPCRRWLYDPAEQGATVVSEWDLVCERRPLLSTIQSVMQLGGLLGSLAAGYLGDRLGRRVVYLLMMVLYVGSALLSAGAGSYQLFVVTRFVTGVGWMGMVSSSFVLIVELTGRRWRATAGQLFMLPNALGQMLLAAAAYRLRVWWQLQLALAAPCLSFLANFWLVPESPRWLILRGRDDQALAVLAAAARANGRRLPATARLRRLLADVRRCELADQEAAAAGGGGPCAAAGQLWRSPRLRRWTLATGACWAAVGGAYFGITFDVTQLSASPYLACALSGLVEVPAYLMAPLLNRVGRRPLAATTFLLAGLAILAILARRDPTLWLALGLLGKFFVTAAYGMLFVYTPEYIPTSVRTVGFGFANVCSRVGAMASPYVVDLLRDADAAAPAAVFGTCCLLAGLAALLLPETAGRRLPETVAELEAGALDEPAAPAKAEPPPAEVPLVSVLPPPGRAETCPLRPADGAGA